MEPDRELGKLDYVFCDDEYLAEINLQYLNHDTYTDVITFDYSEGEEIVGDIFISIERVRENATEREIAFDEELRRVMAHGVLHLLGFNDEEDAERAAMRAKEDEVLAKFHVEP